MKLPYGCGERTGKVTKLDRALYGIKQAGRQWSAVLCQALVDEHGMEQCRADPCVYRKIVEGVVKPILVVHVDDILVSGGKEVCDELHHTLNGNFPTENLGELTWYLGCATECDWRGESVTIKQPVMIDALTMLITPASKDTDRRSISGVAVMLGNAAVYATSRTQHYVTLSTTEAEYVALAEGVKEGMFVILLMYFMQPNVYEITLMEDNEGAKAMAGNPLSSGRSKHIDIRWHFIRELVEKKELKVVHVASEWQYADLLTKKALHVKLFKRHRKALLNLPAVE